jgi:hypothetical protein
MKYLILAATALIGLACSSHSQTIKSLGYDTTNGQVIYGGTNPLTFTNPLQFESGVRAATRTNLGSTSIGDSVFTAASAASAATTIGLGTTNSPTFSNLTLNGTLGVSDAATFSTNVTVNGNISVGSLTTTTPSTWALDATQTAAETNGVLALPSNANVIRLTNNNAISGVSGGVLGAFYYLVNQTTNAVTISNVGGITVQGGTPLTLGANEAATLVATGATNASVAARGDLTDVALGGTANTAPSQTASSGSSLMTRDLSDGRYFGFSHLFYEKQDFATANIGTTNGGGLNASRGNVRFTMQTTNGSGAMWIGAVKRAVFGTQGKSTAKEGYGVYALTPNTGANTDVLFGVFYGSALPNGVSSFEPLSTNGYSVQFRNNGTNQLRYVYKNGTNEVSGPWTSLPSSSSSMVEIAAVNTTNGFRVLYRRPEGVGTPDWTTLTNVEVAWTNSSYVGSVFGGIGVIRTNTHTNVTVYDPNEWGFIIGGENL